MRQYESILCQREDFDHDNPPSRVENRSRSWGLVSGAAAGDRRHYALQPILNASQKVVGREALYRSGWDDQFDGDPDAATRIMIDNWLLYGFKDTTSRTLTFINCTREALVSGLLTLLPPWAVLEVLETVEPDGEVVRACRRLKKLGYRISLDDFESSEKMEGLLELADFVKIDFRCTNVEERQRLRRSLRGSEATLIAEKVETEEEFLMAKREGFQLFQGFYFREKASFAMTRDAFGETRCLRLLEASAERGCSIGSLADLIAESPGIACRLLRMANWLTVGGQPVNSIRDSLKLVGRRKFRKLVLLVMLAEAATWDGLAPEALQYCEMAGLRSGVEGVPEAKEKGRKASNVITMGKSFRKP